MVISVPVVAYAQRTFNAADNATGYAADNAAHEPADRS
jgi:hypothetical protein